MKKVIIEQICQKAKIASVQLAQLATEQKNLALCNMADELEANCNKILEANQKDVQAARTKGIKESLIDRLVLTEKRIQGMASDLREVTTLADPVNEIVKTWTRPNGLIIGQMRVPLE